MDLKAFAVNIYCENGIWFSSDQKKVSYPEEGNKTFFQLEENSFWFRHRNDCISGLIKKYAPGSLFFDIGGGNGYVSKALQNEGIETVLIEPGLQGCRNAQQRGLTNIICSTLEDAGFAAGSLESCGMFDVVEHIKEDASFFKNIYHYLKPGGYCFITVPAYNWLWSYEDVDAGHYRRYNKKSISTVLLTSGFQVTYASYFFSFLILPVYFFRTLPSYWKKKSNRSPERHEEDHKSEGLVKNIVDGLCRMELKRIHTMKIIPFGSSVIVVAQKPL